jgi:hypothetical protein
LEIDFALIFGGRRNGLWWKGVRDPRNTQRVLEYQSLGIAFTLAFRLGAIFAYGLFFAAFDAALSAS